jgi:hypothetical protein
MGRPLFQMEQEETCFPSFKDNDWSFCKICRLILKWIELPQIFTDTRYIRKRRDTPWE